MSSSISYGPWGKRRNANGTDDPTDSITSQTTRGFTGQEELSVSGLVHLNGRVYDPTLERMTSADPTVPDPLDPQAWNRYSYVGNDPLTFTDPSGFGTFGGPKELKHEELMQMKIWLSTDTRSANLRILQVGLRASDNGSYWKPIQRA